VVLFTVGNRNKMPTTSNP